MATAGSQIEPAYQRAAEVVRAQDSDRYLADLFIAESQRRHILALHAFNAEVSRIRDVVTDPMLGEIRLQWWRDAVLEGAGGGNPVALALADTIDKFSLPLAAFERLLDARTFDLFNDPMPTLNDLEGYAGDTSSALFQLAAIVLANGHEPGSADLSGHAGVAYAITGLLRALPRHAARAQSYLPEAMARARGVDLANVFGRQDSPELRGLLADLRTVARQHLTEAQRAMSDVGPGVRAAFLPVALVRPYLDRMDTQRYDPFVGVELMAWRKQWILWRAARRLGG